MAKNICQSLLKYQDTAFFNNLNIRILTFSSTFSHLPPSHCFTLTSSWLKTFCDELCLGSVQLCPLTLAFSHLSLLACLRHFGRGRLSFSQSIAYLMPLQLPLETFPQVPLITRKAWVFFQNCCTYLSFPSVFGTQRIFKRVLREQLTEKYFNAWNFHNIVD